MCIDRKNRDLLTKAIREYLEEKTTAFEFDDEIFIIADDSKDPTVDEIAKALWCHYDDCKDHKVNLSKEEWDYFNRLILLLKSNAHLKVVKHRNWSFTQIIAVSLLSFFCWHLYDYGFHPYLLFITAPLGVISILISRYHCKQTIKPTPNQIALMPFNSNSQLLSIRRTVPAFIKKIYPTAFEPKQIRSKGEERALSLQLYIAWLAFSPLVLFAQIFPRTEESASVVHQAV
jgi:hypothetical protein